MSLKAYCNKMMGHTTRAFLFPIKLSSAGPYPQPYIYLLCLIVLLVTGWLDSYDHD